MYVIYISRKKKKAEIQAQDLMVKVANCQQMFNQARYVMSSLGPNLEDEMGTSDGCPQQFSLPRSF